MMKNPAVDFYFTKEKTWKSEIQALRTIALNTGLTEELKWGNPCYTFNGKNIVLIHVFKEYCALLLFKGAILPDPDGILIQQTENVQAARQIRFRSMEDIEGKEAILKAYILSALEVEKSGKKVALKKAAEFPTCEEFISKLNELPGLKQAFDALTPGRQRAYLLYFSQPKQAKTRESRIEKSIPLILDGKGLND